MKNVNRALSYLKTYWLLAVGAGVALIVVNLANLVTPQLLRILVDEGIQPLDLPRIYQIAALMVGLALIRGIFNFLQGYWSEVSSQGVAYDLRNRIFEKLQNLSFSYHDRSQTGKLMTRMTSDVEITRMYVGRGFMMLISAIFMLVGTIIIMFVMNWKLSLILTFVILVVFLFFGIFVRRIMPVAFEVQKKLGLLNTVLQENLAGLRVVKAFAREEFETERYLKQNQELLHENINLARLFSSVFPMIFFIANQGVVVVIWYGGLQVISNHLTLGELVAFNGYILFLLIPVFQMGMLGAMLSRAEASAARIFEVMDAKSEVEDKAGATPLPPIKGEIEFSNVSFRYVGTDQDVIQNISFRAESGETIAILGQTGAGKSSIINLIPRFYDVTSGKILVDGIDIRDITLESLRSQIGIVLQETSLFSGSIRDNISYGRPDANLEDVISAAKAAQAHEFITEFPDGYETMVGERGVGLSGGQKQRVAIARALLVNPQILILDDSTSSVDAETEYYIQQALERLMQDRTSFVIAQRISTVRNADKILVLENGRLTAQGKHEDLLKSSELYVEILETQFGERAEWLPEDEEELA